MKVCYFGAYDREHPRNVVLRKGLVQNGVKVIECHDTHRLKPLRLLRLFLKYARISREVDAVVVGACGHAYVPAARLVASFSRRPVIFDAFVSQYDTVIQDRKDASPGSWRGRYCRWLDRSASACSDLILFDTPEQCDYFAREYGVAASKLASILVGADDEFFQPAKRGESETFNVLFVGSFIPLQGIEHIVSAAGLLQHDSSIQFRIVGDGQTYPTVRRVADALELRHLRFSPPVGKEEYVRLLATADVALGIFGAGAKTQRVVPCKVYDALACARPVITGDTAATRSLLRDGDNALLSPVADPAALAERILRLKSDPALRQRIAANGHRLYRENATPLVLGHQAEQIIAASIATRSNGKAH